MSPVLRLTLYHACCWFQADDIKKALQSAQEESAHAMADRSRLELEERNVQQESKREQDNLNRKAKDYSNSLKRCKRAEVQLQTAQAQVPFMRRQLEEASRQVQALMEEGKKQRAAVEELKREVGAYLKRHFHFHDTSRVCSSLASCIPTDLVAARALSLHLRPPSG